MQTLNVGLHNPFFNEFNSLSRTIREIVAHVSDVQDIRVSYSGDEPTVIVLFDYFIKPVEHLARALDQDCVALYNHERNEGYLLGDKASEWGDFNPQYFQHI